MLRNKDLGDPRGPDLLRAPELAGSGNELDASHPPFLSRRRRRVVGGLSSNCKSTRTTPQSSLSLFFGGRMMSTGPESGDEADLLRLCLPGTPYE